MSDFNEMGWRDKFDRLELLADPELMPLVVSIRADMELMSASTLHLLDTVRDVRRELQSLLQSKAPA